MENKKNNLQENVSSEEFERARYIRRIRNQLNHYTYLVMDESLGGNAGRSARGRLQAGLNAFVNRNTGEIIFAGNNIKKEFTENPDLSSVIFTYEVGEKNNFENGNFINVQETNFGSSLTIEALNRLKMAVQIIPSD